MSTGKPVDLTPEAVQAFWAEREPRLLSFFQEMDNKEHWSIRDIAPEFSALYAEIGELLSSHEQLQGLDNPLVKEGVARLTSAAAALPCSASSVFFEWIGEMNQYLPYGMLKHAHEQHQANPDCSVIWQRARMVARYQILKDIVADITGGGSPL
jgi:hypothetical protein